MNKYAMSQDLIKGCIDNLYPERAGQTIEGQHEALELWQDWYSGRTKDHYRDGVRDGEKIQVPLKASGFAKMICEDWASSFMNEELTITIPNEKENELLQQMLKEKNFFLRINNFTEKYFALGMAATVVYLEMEYEEGNNELTPKADSKLLIDFVDATRIVPITVYNGEVIEVAFVKRGTNKCSIQLHMINEQGYYDIHEIKGSYSNGQTVMNYKDTMVWHTKSNTPLFQIWHPNVADNKVIDNELGTSVFANCLDELMVFDVIFDKFHTEYKNGGKKRFISTSLMSINKDTGEYDKVPFGDEDIYLPPAATGNANNMVVENSSELRADAFVKGLSFYANLIGRNCGLGDSHFSFDAQGGRPIQTATGVIAKEQDVVKAVRKNENLATSKLQNFLMAIKYVESEIGVNFTYEKNDIQIVFDDNILEDTTAKKEAERQEVERGIMHPAEYRAHWFDEDYDTALQFLQDNVMLLNFYAPHLASGAITPEKFVDLVYGENCKDKQSIIDYINSKNSTPSNDLLSYEDENADKTEKEEETKIEVGD